MANGAGGRGRGNSLVLLLVFIAVVAGVALALTRGGGRTAPSPTDTPEPTVAPTPPRRVERQPPLREPVVLEESETAEGNVNALILLPAEADAYIASELPTENFGMGDLYLGYSLDEGFGAERIFLSFDVEENVPPGVVINEAAVRMHLRFSSPPDDPPMETWLRELDSPWGELTITWRDGPEWGPIRAGPTVGSAARWYEWDVTDLVGDWVSGAAENHGVAIIGDEAVMQRERAFYSRETPAEGPAARFYPQLIIDYTEVDDAQPPVTEIDPLPAYVLPAFLVSWGGEDRGPAGIASYDVEYQVDGGDWTRWLTDVAFTSIYFEGGENLRRYEFRVRAEDRVGNVEPFGGAEASTTVDGEPPQSHVRQLPATVHEETFNVVWVGHDHGSGIQYFDVRYRLDGGEWVLWQQRTLAGNAAFTAPSDGRYDFEVRAADELGQREPFTGQPEASITVDARAPYVEP